MNDPRFPILVVLLACALAATTDIRRFKVSNTLTLTLLATGLCYHFAVGGWQGLGRSLGGGAFGFAALIFPYAAGGMGAGDVKLSAGVGAWLGLPMTYEVLIAAAIAGGVYALILTVATGRVRENWANVKRLLAQGASRVEEPVQKIVNDSERRRRLVPFAAMVAVGLIATIIRF